MYEIVESIDGERGKVGRVQITAPPTFAQIFDGSPQFYPGSLVQVQEILEIRTKIYDESIVDQDFGWFFNKSRLGTYQVIDPVGLVRTGVGDDGYLSIFNQKIYRNSFYTITANPDTPFAKYEQIALDNCNAYLTPEIYIFPNDPTPDAGFRYYDRNPLFLGSSTISKAPLADTDFNQLIYGVGLYLKPGVEGDFLRYRVSIINDIYTDYSPAISPTCEFLRGDCNAEFIAFLNSRPGQYYSSQQECSIINGNQNGLATPLPCQSAFWSCTFNPTDVREYYFLTVS